MAEKNLLKKDSAKKAETKKDGIARVKGNNIRISFKFSVEACSFIRGKKLERAMKHLEMVVDKKMAIPMKRFNRDQAHKPGKIAAGRYPEKVSKAFLNLLITLRANSEDQGDSVKDMVITKAVANKAASRWKHGRIRGRQMKGTNVELEATEVKK